MLLELTAFFLIISLSLDSLFCAWTYGTSHIKISWYNMVFFAIVAAIIYIASVLFSSLIQQNINIEVMKIIGATVLILLGLYKICDPLIKGIIKKHPKAKRNILFKVSSLQIIINIYANPCDADINHSQSLSFKETFLLAVTMNIDSLFVGLTINHAQNSWYLVGLLAFAVNFVFLISGYFIGEKIGTNKDKDYSYLCGFLLILLGIKMLF